MKIHPSSIADRHHNNLAKIREEMLSSSAIDLMNKYQVGKQSVQNWEVWYGVRTPRFCFSHHDYVPYERMAKGVLGQCKAVCVDCEGTSKGHGDPRFGVDRSLERLMSATGPSVPYRCQPNVQLEGYA